MTSADDELLPYYQEELTYLRRMGTAFAQRFRKVAARLELGPDQSADPNVERLIESFAFLTARLQYHLKAEFPEITAALLGILYPQFLDPIPSMAIARFEADPVRVKLTTGYTVPKGTSLFAEADQDSDHGPSRRAVCRFRTCYPVTLWPVAVTEAAIADADQVDFAVRDAAAVLRLTIAGRGDPLHKFDLRRLRFFLNADPALSGMLYELLTRTGNVRWIGLRPEGTGAVRRLPEARIEPAGFAADEDVLPYPAHALPAYRLLQEYFEFPEKFLFLDIAGLSTAGVERSFELVIGLDSAPDRLLAAGAVGPETFALGCTPVINLFRKLSEPVRLTHRQTEYRLIPDLRQERLCEIHTVLSISSSTNPAESEAAIAPFYSFNHAHAEREPSLYWFARRQPTGRVDLPGTEIQLSFLDLTLRPAIPALQTVYAHTLCTNRTLAEHLPAGAALQAEQPVPSSRITCLRKPTAQRLPALGGATAWRLISQLSLNHLSLSGGPQSLPALREILRLHGGNPNALVERQVMAIRSLQCRPTVHRIGKEAWRGFVRGTEITLELDESWTGSGHPLLLAAVLNHFFALYTSVNSFTRLVVTSTQRSSRIWMEWPPMIGYQAVI